MFLEPSIAGVVLCGGMSRRMGRDKASLPFGDETMLGRVVRQLAQVATPIVVVAAAGQILPALPDETILVRDAVAGRGPWQGIAAGLRTVNTELAFVAGCDGPFLEPGWVRKLAELIGDKHAAVPFVDDCYQPLAALYRTAIVSEIERLLQEAHPRPWELFDRTPTRRVLAEELRDIDPLLRTLRNINTMDDYRQALSEMD